MRLLIAGWHGQIARALVELAPARPDITALSVGRPALDLCRPSSIRSNLVKALPDIMINTAAYTAVDKAESEPEAVFQLNCAGAAAYAAVAAKAGIPVIHLSSDYVFDGTKKSPYTEDDEPAPQSVYGRSKLDGELAVADANPKHVILRTAWVYSPYGRNFVKTMLGLATERSKIDVVGDQVGCPTYALHLAEAILDIAAQIASGRNAAPWGTYHAASAGGVSWFEFAKQVFDVSGRLGGPTAEIRSITTAEYATSAPRLSNARLDSSRLKQAFGVQLPAWTEGLEDCLRRLTSTDLH
ncbi:MAG: dTDP-4-dehydrorhamnose reductase [Methyloligellaceae bacterium]